LACPWNISDWHNPCIFTTFPETNPLTALAIVLAAMLLGLMIVQSFLVWGFVRALRNFDVPLIEDEVAPKASVILCLRGTDPFLKDCLRGVLNQDYPDYQVRIVVDSSSDPAHLVLNEVLAEMRPENVRIENLINPSSRCSLKCSSLRQVVDNLEPGCEIVAQLDADTIAHSTWLRELATALQGDDVGAATGNRWFMPQTVSIGSLVRYTWNAAAIVQMYWYKIAWGGTLAVKARILRESDLAELWSRAFCEDTMLHAQLKKLGMRVKFVPSLVMINRENTSLGGFFRWVSRQLMTAKLYHPAWPAVLVHGVVSTLAPLGAIALLVAATAAGKSVAVSIVAMALAAYAVSMLLALWSMCLSVRILVVNRGEPGRWLKPADMIKCAAVMPLTQIVYPVALATATLAKSSNWRGIHYEIKGPWQIRMKEYVRYGSAATPQVDESL
jgi:GT2 family glycosyltransferase